MVTKRNRVQVDRNATASPGTDTLRALTVPFKGTPKLSGVGDNYERLANSLGKFSNALGGLASMGASLDAKNRQDALDLELQADVLERWSKGSAADAHNFVADTGVNPVAETYTNITRLKTGVLPGHEKQLSEWRVAQESDPNGWTKPEVDDKGKPVLDEAGNPKLVPMVREDIKLKYDQFVFQGTKEYAFENVHSPQFREIVSFADRERKKDEDAFDAFVEKKIIVQGRSIAAENAPTILLNAAKMTDGSPQAITDAFTKSMNKIAQDVSQGTALKDRGKLEIAREGLDSAENAARQDPEIASIVEDMIADGGRMPQGGTFLAHPELKASAEAALKTANKTLLRIDHNDKLLGVKARAKSSKLPLSLSIDDDLASERADRLGNIEKLKTDKDALIKEIAKEMDDEVAVQGNLAAKPAEAVLAAKVRTASRKGYVSPSIQAFFEGPIFEPGGAFDNDVQDRVATSLAAYRQIKAEAPLAIQDYIKDADSRNVLQALDLVSEYEDGKQPDAAIIEKIHSNLGEDGQPIDALSDYKADRKTWEATDTYKRLSTTERQDVKDIFNLSYGSDRDLDDIPAKLEAISQRVAAGSYELNGSRLPLPAGVVPKGVPRAKFLENMNEYVDDALKQHAPQFTRSNVKVVPLHGGTSFYLTDEKGNYVRSREGGKPVILKAQDVMGHLDTKYKPQRDHEKQKSTNSVIERRPDYVAPPFEGYRGRGGKPVAKFKK